jgi:hypothetical protein
VNPFLTLKRHAEEDEDERKLCKNVEPLVMRLERGINCFTEPEFTWLAKYMLPEDERERARQDGKFSVGEIVVARSTGRLLTVSEIAREINVPRPTVWVWVSKSKVRPVKSKSGKRYDLAQLASFLLRRSA